MSRIREAFQNSKVFIPFLTCGDPDLATTAALVRRAAAAGAGLIELGIPFSDPTAEGPVIQEASLRALSGGVTVDRILEMVRELRKDVTVPMVFMTYANVVFSYGTDRFLKESAQAGMDGLILPDVPFEEKGDFDRACRRYGMDLISLIAPTSKERITAIAKEASGFIYIVSSLGVTGVRSEITTDIGAITAQIRSCTDVPCAVGFGISTPEQAAKMAAVSDGVIVGSAIVRLVEKYGSGSPDPVERYIREMTEAISNG